MPEDAEKYEFMFSSELTATSSSSYRNGEGYIPSFTFPMTGLLLV